MEQAKKLQQFRRDADELEAWIKEKVQIASDEAYKDRRNLQVSMKRADQRLASFKVWLASVAGKNAETPGV